MEQACRKSFRILSGIKKESAKISGCTGTESARLSCFGQHIGRLGGHFAQLDQLFFRLRTQLRESGLSSRCAKTLSYTDQQRQVLGGASRAARAASRAAEQRDTNRLLVAVGRFQERAQQLEAFKDSTQKMIRAACAD